ncbi:flagellar basal-body MS-ring/collar protein FliF [Roseibacterium sp. SDUM158016]|uniref:flagellar basal-body MS-ring/collar protein FliF n=1 Tax=Roseicyclus sediminis TaxID=2980997 RepID=UPI0021D36E94|nr:flagellar basal-body MS-ring/collar protein FliF [Roseibacterium sp. SDUM158016]MCU4654320.1 flagellar basal-body MS-ring/collar protein FliF [Roseibacterium sp. SDUM158016]
MQALLDNLNALGRRRLIFLGGVGFALVMAVLLGVSYTLTPTYAPLYSELSPASASRVVSSLEQAGFRVSVSRDGSVVSVPQEDIARARMALADAGLPTEGSPGWELFDTNTGLGMNTFLQRVNRLRALEGELARSIQTIDGIEAARVHLVLPEREAFSRTRPEPSASVIIRSRLGDSVSRRQAIAIRALVASAVPDLAPGRITVLSATGETILAEDDQETPASMLQSRKVALEERMSENIMSILSARVGTGNARVQVNVDLTSTRSITRSETFDPEQQVVRSTETREESGRDQRPGSQEVGVGSNLPDDFGGTAATGELNETQRTDEIVNYEIGSTLTEMVSEPGAIERISVAVLVDGIYTEDAAGELVFVPRDEAELNRLEELVRAAVGFNAQRGDTVSVESLQFVDIVQTVGDPVGSSFSSILMQSVPTILRGVFALAIVAAVLSLGLRPALKILATRLDPPPASGPAQLEADGVPPNRPQIASAENVMGGATVLMPSGEIGSSDTIRVSSVVGDISRQSVRQASALVIQQPDETLRTVKGWLVAK